jgi:2-aminoadipate transaminase
MRLNFSGVDEAEIREGVCRIGKVIAEQINLYDTLTGRSQGEPDGRPNSSASVSDSPRTDSADVVPFKKAAEGGP